MNSSSINNEGQLTLRLFHVVGKDVLCTYQRWSAAGSMERGTRARPYVGPCHQVIRRFAEVEDGGVLHDFVRDVQIIGVRSAKRESETKR